MGTENSYRDLIIDQRGNLIQTPEAPPLTGKNNWQTYQIRNPAPYVDYNHSLIINNVSQTFNGMPTGNCGQQTLNMLPSNLQLRNDALQDHNLVRTLGFGAGNLGGKQNFVRDDLQHASAESVSGVYQPQHHRFGNIQNPHSTVFPSNFYANMGIYNSSNLPRGNYGLLPHPEVDNGLPSLSEINMLPAVDRFMASQSSPSGSHQSTQWNAQLNQQLYQPPESMTHYSSIEEFKLHGVLDLYANRNSNEKMNAMRRVCQNDLGSNHCQSMFSPSKRLKVGSCLPVHSSDSVSLQPDQLNSFPDKSLKLPPLQQWPSSCFSTDSSTVMQTSVDQVTNSMDDPECATKSLQITANSLHTSSAQNPWSNLRDNIVDHSLEDKGPGETCSNIRGSSYTPTLEMTENFPLPVVRKVHSFDELFTRPSANQAIGDPGSVKSNSEKESHIPGQPPKISDIIASNADSTFPENLGCQEEMNNEESEVVVEPEKDVSPVLDYRTQINLEKETNTKNLKRRGVSLVEGFSAEQIREHVTGLRQWATETGSREGNGDKEMPALEDDLCQLCGENTILFSPPPLYCSSCSGRIKVSAIYYTSEEVKRTSHLLCSSCHKNFRGDITLSGTKISKTKLFKRKNNSNTEEKWVQCDNCNRWQHQICGLYNAEMDVEGKAQYTCPKCLLEEKLSIYADLKTGMEFGAKDLPCTILSNYIEQRLLRRLRQEREETAKATGKSVDDVSEPEDLVVRVVLSVDKHLKVNKQFADMFHDEEYPTEFPFRSKAILLFQKIEGVDLCLFGLYVQEFGSECSQPNQRCVYISYLDSVKYFRPERVASTGEPLRTFVYHEILIAYLEYCKKRGFATCYIWACPPTKGEDYILYCHPETQKTPKPDKLRQWYLSMLKKAAEERVVLNVTNLYQRFFVLMEQSTCKITAARLPYFDGAYWSCAAENFVQDMERGGKDEVQKKMKLVTNRKLKAFGYKSPPESAAKDILVMQKLGETIVPVKENLMVVQLHYSCIRCSRAILSGWRWFCEKCKNFQLCERCHDAEQKTGGEDTHTAKVKGKHLLSKVMMNDIPSTTEDNDIILENDLFENRHGFLDFCQKQHYQFDTLRRAKHSSMMILYHLHNPSEQISQQSSCTKVICTLCDSDITNELHHPCLICSNYKACMRCYKERNTKSGIHLFADNPSAHGTKAEDADQKIALVNETLNALRHATLCRATKTPCSFPKCISVKKLFRHALKCKVRVPGGCTPCKKAWMILGLHATHCEEPNCRVLYCREKKERGSRDGRNIQRQ